MVELERELVRRMLELERRIERLEAQEKFKSGPTCIVYNNANVAWPTGVYNTAFTFNTEQVDEYAMWDASDPTKIIAKVSGWYHVYAKATWAVNATGIRFIAINRNAFYLNGQYAVQVQASASETMRMSVSGVFWMDVNDYIRLRPYQTSGGNLDMSYVAGASVYMGMTRIASVW